MSFADVVLGQLDTFSDKDVERLHFTLKLEYEKRVEAQAKKVQMSGLQKLEALFPNIYQTCESIKMIDDRFERFHIEFTPHAVFLVMGNFNFGKRLLQPPYTVHLQKAHGTTGYEATFNLNQTGGSQYSDLQYSYMSDNPNMPMYPSTVDRTGTWIKCNESLPSQLKSIPLVSEIICNADKVYTALSK
jgi:hypothetical protein